ncbi:hypothetical protein HDU91_006160 [Kappamyces sp. JEL0680]|nr:hypothetical protein HDU91_006160 [Kappamyces sp. JEL0680]
MAVKPLILQIYLTYLIPLGPRLVPSLKAVILSLLAFLDEEGNEFFDQAALLLDKIIQATNLPSFYASFWLAVSGSVQCRTAACNFLLKKMPKIRTREDMAAICGHHSQLLVDALCALVEDGAFLVKRGGLELLVTQFHFKHSSFSVAEKHQIIESAIAVVLSKDMSLNRRLYSILQDCEAEVATILKSLFLRPAPDLAELQKPYKILLHFLDRAHFGEKIVDSVLVVMLQALHAKCSTSPETLQAIMPIATVLVSAINPYLLWKTIHFWLIRRRDEPDRFAIIHFLMDHFSFSEAETQRVHLPFFFYSITCLMAEGKVRFEDLDAALALAQKTSTILSSTVYTNTWSLSEFRGPSQEETVRSAVESSPFSPSAPLMSIGRVISIKDISLIYHSQDDHDSHRKALFDRIVLGRPIIEDASENVFELLVFFQRHWETKQDATMALIWSRICSLVEKLSEFYVHDSWPASEWWTSLLTLTLNATELGMILPGMNLLTKIARALKCTERALFHRVLEKIWDYLDPSLGPDSHTMLVLLGRIRDIIGARDAEQKVAKLIQLSSSDGVFDKFGFIWHHNEQLPRNEQLPLCLPTFQIYQLLLDEGGPGRAQAMAWIGNYVTSFRLFIAPLLEIVAHGDIEFRFETGSAKTRIWLQKPFNQAQVDYAFQVLLQLVIGCEKHLLECLSSESRPAVYRLPWPSVPDSDPLTLADSLLLYCLLFIVASPRCESGFSPTLQQSIVARASRLLCVLIPTSPETAVREPIGSAIYQSLLHYLESTPCHAVQSDTLLAFDAISTYVYRAALLDRLHPTPKDKEDMVRTLMPFRRSVVGRNLVYWVRTVQSRIPWCFDHFESTVLVVLQEFAAEIAGHAATRGAASVVTREDDVVVLLGGLDFVLTQTLAAPCADACFSHMALVFAALVRTLNSLDLSASVFSKQILDKASCIVKKVAKSNLEYCLEALVHAWISIQDGKARRRVFQLLSFTGLGVSVIFSTVAVSLKKRLALHADQAFVVDIAAVDELEFVHDFFPHIPKDLGLLTQCWMSLYPVLKEVCLQPAAFRHLVLPSLSVLDRLFDMVTLENRKTWKESSDVYCKLYEACVQAAAKMFDRDRRKENTPDQPRHSGSSNTMARPSGKTAAREMLSYLAGAGTASLRSRLDPERVVQLIAHLAQAVIGPALRSKDVENVLHSGTVLKIIVLLANIPYGFKAWKKDVWQAFMDDQFFMVGFSALSCWKSIVHSLVLHDQGYMTEVLLKVSNAGSAGIFASKDLEYAERGTMLRRLAFLVFAGPIDHYLVRLPSFQEKIAESLKLSSPVVNAQVFFFIQILLLRVSQKNLSSLWIVLVHELVKTLAKATREPLPATDSSVDDELLEALKLLVLTIHLKLDDFQSFQWIFIRDSTELLSHPRRPPLAIALEQMVVGERGSHPVTLEQLFLASRVSGSIPLEEYFRWINGPRGPESVDFEAVFMNSFLTDSVSFQT